MSYPGTFVTWRDESAIPSNVAITQLDSSPLFCALFTSDMGPENWNTVVGDEFFKLYGEDISFNKHGQPLLQAAMQINSGAKLFCKRIVAKDATYANIGVIANVTAATAGGEPVLDEMDNPLYWAKDPMTGENLDVQTTNATTEVDDGTKTGNTTTVNNDPVLTEASNAKIKYESYSVEGAKSIDEVYEKFEEQYDAASGKYPLFIFAENGRGISKKSWNIVPDYTASKNSKFMAYVINIMVDGETSGSYQFTFNPDYIINGKSYCLQQRVIDNTKQLKCKQFDSYINDFISAVAAAMSTESVTVSADDIKNQDVLFGYTRKGAVLSTNVTYEVNSEFSMESAYGNKLINGSTGSFGDYPLKANSTDPSKDTYVAAMLRAFDENICPEIYDVENNKFIAIIDANYPEEVKRKIEEVAIFREDFRFLRDAGTKGLTSWPEIEEKYNGTEEDPGVARTKFVNFYPTYFDVYDPYTKKQITVTATYLLAIKYITHVMNGINQPFCGIRYNVTFPEVIPGTVSFLPSVTPSNDTKTKMNDARINYFAYHNELLVLETDYDTQEAYTQWSFGYNVAATQAVIRAIRTRCPIIRYALATKSGLAEYEADIKTNVLNNYISWFKSLTFKYVGDVISEANKQYYAAIGVSFGDYLQEEYFTITALPVSES